MKIKTSKEHFANVGEEYYLVETMRTVHKTSTSTFELTKERPFTWPGGRYLSGDKGWLGGEQIADGTFNRYALGRHKVIGFTDAKNYRVFVTQELL